MLPVHEHAMTEQQPTEPAASDTKATADATESRAEAEKDEDGDKEDEEEDEEDDDDKESKKKKDKDKDKDEGDKPKRVKIEFEGTMPRNEAVSYFEAIVGGLRSGRLEFKQGEQTLVLNPPDQLEIEVKASSKGDKGSIVFEIEWSAENRPLEISN
jgi:amphi-Trp domain-containing protein